MEAVFERKQEDVYVGMTAMLGTEALDMLNIVQRQALQQDGSRQVFVRVSSYQEFITVCASAEEKLCDMHQKDIVLLCTQLKTYDRKKKTEATLNIVWVPYIVSETVMAEVQKFNLKGTAKTFAIAAINDVKVSIQEAV